MKTGDSAAPKQRFILQAQEIIPYLLILYGGAIILALLAS